MKHKGTIKPDGSLIVKARSLFDEGLRLMAREKEVAVVIEIKPEKKYRSVFQNSYYWGIVIPIVVNLFNENGNNVDADQVHEFLKAEVGKLNQKLILPDGEIKDVTISSAKLKTMEFEDYLAKIRAWAAEWGCIVPMPNEGGVDES